MNRKCYNPTVCLSYEPSNGYTCESHGVLPLKLTRMLFFDFCLSPEDDLIAEELKGAGINIDVVFLVRDGN